jgi:hypothetical protein
MLPLSIVILFSPACHFSRNNPNDIAGADYAGVSILRPGNGAQITIDTLVVTWQGQGEVAEYNYRLDNGAWTSVGTGTSLVLRNLEEGDHFIEIRITNKKGKDSTAGVDFTVNALTGPSILISPQITRVIAADTAAVVSVNLEGVDRVLGVNAVLVFDHTKVGFKKASSAWSFFKADTLGKDTLELSAACLDSVNGFSGSGQLAGLTFRLVNVTPASTADIVFLAGKTKWTPVTGGDAQFRNLRKGSISR